MSQQNHHPAPVFAHACEVLEYPRLLAVISRHAGSLLGAAAVRALTPETGIECLVSRRTLYHDGMTVLAAGASLPVLHVPDLTEMLVRVAPEGALVPGEELLPIGRQLDTVRAVAEFARGRTAEHARSMRELIAGLDPLRPLAAQLQRTLDENGHLQDNASPLLVELRQRLHTLEQALQRRLEGLLRHLSAEPGVLQDEFVTQRNGRYVIPVRREARHRFTGVVHDHSDSGRTLFVEPADTLPLGNELADLRLEERDECRRLLMDLCDAVRLAAAALRQNQEQLVTLDAAIAVARWAHEAGAILPHFGARFALHRARHPLLLEQFRQEKRQSALVPIDLDPPSDCRVLVVSGPNCGGKTAALKTVGLLALAAQSGLPVPVDEQSEFLFFPQIFADIGDEQSLAHNLSTFTGHLSQVRAILERAAGTRSLVLLDEIGAGTDPLEGGALACAILSTLAEAGALTIATTHLGAVKTFVHEAPGMVNAAVRFNLETMAPEYAIDYGVPGASQALTIARRVGFPEAVLQRATAMLSSDHLHLEGMLAEIEETQRQIAQRENQVQQTLSSLKDERDQVRTELDRLKKERRDMLHDAYSQADHIVANARRQMERLIAESRRTADTANAAAEAEALAARQRELRKDMEEREAKLQKALAETAPKPAAPLPARDLRIGQKVWVEKLKTNARIVAVADDHQRVIVATQGGVRFTVQAKEIGRQDDTAQETAPPRPAESRPRVQGHVAQELLLLGKRVEEAEPLLQQFLDRAAMAGLPEVRVVHGFGTGRLQQGVHELLRQHPKVAAFRLGRGGEEPGGGGVTLVRLKAE